jgi:hypothetical protein
VDPAPERRPRRSPRPSRARRPNAQRLTPRAPLRVPWAPCSRPPRHDSDSHHGAKRRA